jgi:hypothetical protein
MMRCCETRKRNTLSGNRAGSSQNSELDWKRDRCKPSAPWAPSLIAVTRFLATKDGLGARRVTNVVIVHGDDLGQPGPQTEFLQPAVDICICSGAAGGGKTVGLMLEPLRHIGRVANFTAAFFRRTTPQITNPGALWGCRGGLLGERVSGPRGCRRSAPLHPRLGKDRLGRSA